MKRRQYEDAKGLQKLFLYSQNWIKTHPVFSIVWVLVVFLTGVNFTLIIGWSLETCHSDEIVTIRPLIFPPNKIPSYSQNIWNLEFQTIKSLTTDNVTVFYSNTSEIVIQQGNVIFNTTKHKFEEFLNYIQPCLNVCMKNQNGVDLKCIRLKFEKSFMCLNANDSIDFVLIGSINITANALENIIQWYI